MQKTLKNFCDSPLRFQQSRRSLTVKTKLKKYPFLERVCDGPSLFVGEGNLSFALSIAEILGVIRQIMVASVFEKRDHITNETHNNAQTLSRLGAKVFCEIDATRVDYQFRNFEFDTIFFQFPNTGSRQAKYGRNSNHHLLTKFLRAANSILSDIGEAVVTIVNRPHYIGAFNVENAAEKSGFLMPECFLFKPSDFPGYHHTNTNDESSAIAKYRSFRTYCFKPKYNRSG